MPGKRLGPSAAPALFVALVMPALLLLLLWGAVPASAATFTVDDTADTHDADVEDGLCADTAGACTLRAAVEQANALDGNDTIVLPAGTYTLTLPPADDDDSGGDLDVLDGVTIEGEGAGVTIIDAAQLDRALHVWPGQALTMTAVTVHNGQTPAGEAPTTRGRGGGILNEGGTLSLGDVILRNNAAAARIAQAGAGGAIYNLNGAVTLSNSLLEDNGAIDVNGGHTLGGAIYNDGGVLTIYGTAFLSNISMADEGFTAAGGALYNGNGGRVTVDGAYFALNSTQAFERASGGAVHNGGGTITMTASTLRNNNSFNLDTYDGGPSYGGALANEGGSLLLENVTLSQNAASAMVSSEAVVAAGGLYNEGEARLNNVTLYYNILEDVYNDGGTVTLANSIAAGEDVICHNETEGEGEMVDGGYNLVPSAACGLSGPGDLLLGPLADNGGRTTPFGTIPTHALQSGSPALDAGNPAAPGSDPAACAATDARGVSRPQDGEGDGVSRCDAGAFEADALPIEGVWVSAAPTTTLGAGTRLTAGVAAGTNPAFTWALGDGETAQGRTVTYTYPAVGVYTATVTVSNSVSLVTATTTVTIVDAPIDGPIFVEASVEPVEVGTVCTFRAQVAGGTGVNYTWDFDDGRTAEGRVVRHTFSAAGEYMVRVTASNGVSEATATQPVTVVQPEWRRLLPLLMGP